jgi:hypothetical protein
MTDKPLLGDPDSNAEFDAGVDAILAKAGVKPLSNPDRVKAASAKDSHDVAQQATGAAKPGLMQNAPGDPPEYRYPSSPTGRVLPNWAQPPQYQYPGYQKHYDTEIMAQMISKSTFPWIGVLGSAQAGGHEVSVHLRQDPVTGFRGKIVNEPRLTDLEEVAAASIKTVKLERDTGGAPRREITTVLIADIVAVTVIEKIEKKS